MSLDSLFPFLQLALNRCLALPSLFPHYSSEARIRQRERRPHNHANTSEQQAHSVMHRSDWYANYRYARNQGRCDSGVASYASTRSLSARRGRMANQPLISQLLHKMTMPACKNSACQPPMLLFVPRARSSADRVLSRHCCEARTDLLDGFERPLQQEWTARRKCDSLSRIQVGAEQV